jgi:hypothetical protein
LFKDNVSTDFLLELLNITITKFNHPLQKMIFNCAERMIRGEELSVEEVILKMTVLKKYPGQYSALNVVYFSSEDFPEEIEIVYEEIINEWKIAQ